MLFVFACNDRGLSIVQFWCSSKSRKTRIIEAFEDSDREQIGVYVTEDFPL